MTRERALEILDEQCGNNQTAHAHMFDYFDALEVDGAFTARGNTAVEPERERLRAIVWELIRGVEILRAEGLCPPGVQAVQANTVELLELIAAASDEAIITAVRKGASL